MASALALRLQIEAALAERIPSALTPARRIMRPVVPTGIGSVDETLQGGLPVGALTEMIGEECSGRTSLALTFLSQVTRAEKVCAWVDVSNALNPESAAACGVDLARLLWVRCGVARQGGAQPVLHDEGKSKDGFSVPKKYFVPKPVKKGLHGGGMGSHPRAEVKGMGDAVSGLLRSGVGAPRCAEPQRRNAVEREIFQAAPRAQIGLDQRQLNGVAIGHGSLWSRIEQALRVTDLLLQAGGFAAIVLDMGGITPEHASRIPLATWFRYRAASERTQASVLLLTQHACSKSSAGLVLRLGSGDALSDGAKVLSGFERQIEVSRQRFSESADKVVSIRKPPQPAGIATWHCETTWAGRR